ncbi:peptidoglycan DD-metalloendopeptidase family protein [Streptomyces sp. NPDC088725]|uniref:M23 family metallopeptidase n=1 Tax=Streptomyces sp. NPDC088725 TaxID=3365873 RepID=UPI00380816E8
MPAKGKHRRPMSRSIRRGIIAVSAGGAALALPLIGATGAHAAEKATPTQTVAAAQTAKTYSVVSGDTLSKIARDQHVAGGWQKLYADNRPAVGADPSVIRPGLKLAVGAAAATAAPEAPAVKKAAAPAFNLPVAIDAIGTPYHQAGSSWASGYHTGVDFVVPSGTPIKAIGAGTVVTAGWGGSYGNQVVIQHPDGTYSQYAHMTSIGVSAGQTVGAGQQIGISGATGNVTGPHLHFEVRTGPDYGSDIDPVAYLRAHGVTV